MEYDKRLAVFSAINDPPIDEDTSTSDMTDNLIHESGRLQLNTYQAFIQNLMNPQSDLKSLMLVHMTGTGKTITALATATEYVRQYDPNIEAVSSIIVLGFTKDIFKKELLSHPEFEFVSMDEVNDLKMMEKHLDDSATIDEQYHIKKRRLQRRLLKREVKGIYQFYGYKQFSNRVINMQDVQSMISKQHKDESIEAFEFDTRIIKSWIQSGEVRINTNFIKSLSHSLFICDEVHNLYKSNSLNTYGLAIQIVFEYFNKTLPVNDIAYGSVRSLLLSATPLTTSALEIIPIINLLTGEDIDKSDIFKTVLGIDEITPIGLDRIRKMLMNKISYIMDDNPKEYPSSNFSGDKIKDIDFIRFVRSKPKGHQERCFKDWSNRSSGISDERGSNMIKDITLPAIKEYPNGVVFSRNINDLDDLPDSVAVHRSADGWTTSKIYHMKELGNYSCKYEKLVQMCMNMKDVKHGKIFIYHPFVQGSGVEMIASILIANGFVFDGDHNSKDSICMNCNVLFGAHQQIKDHEFNPVKFTLITGSLKKNVSASRLNTFNNDNNLYGDRLKIIIGSRAMRESHTLKACRHVIIAHEPSSISEMIQIIGRAVRKHVHSSLPSEMRSVQIHVLTTNVDAIKSLSEDNASNEEHAYRMKVLLFKQINLVDRIMYDVSIDYLINFRFKIRETPQLIGESHHPDIKSYHQYEKTLTRAYTDMRSGITPYGIHTNRFNVFYFEGEVRMVMIIIKRIILNHQPMITISQIISLVREPPFHVDYNTKLISDESIAVAINNLVFRIDQLRLIAPISKLTTVDSLFDKSSTLIDTNNCEYKIICIGDPLCLDSFLAKRSLASILDGDQSIIDSFRHLYMTNSNTPIDLEQLSIVIENSTDINDTIEDLNSEWSKKDTKSVNGMLKKYPNNIHCLLAEWLITYASNIAFNIKSEKNKMIDIEFAKYLIDFYKEKRLLFTVSDLKNSRIYDRYKRFDINTGSSWFAKSSKPSTATLPIGHMIGNSVRIYEPDEQTWLDLNSIGKDVSTIDHPYGFYMYEERVGNSLDVVLKIKYKKDPNSKGLTMNFLQAVDIQKIAQKLQLKMKSDSKLKQNMLDQIENHAWNLQSKMYPKRLIYRLIDM